MALASVRGEANVLDQHLPCSHVCVRRLLPCLSHLPAGLHSFGRWQDRRQDVDKAIILKTFFYDD